MSQDNLKITKTKGFAYSMMKEAHLHTFYEIYYLTNGKRKCFIEDSLYNMDKGDIMLIQKDTLHRTTYVLSETHERYAIYYDDTHISDLYQHFGKDIILKCFEKPQIRIPASRRSYIEELLDNMLFEYSHSDAFSQYLLKKNLEELIIFILRCSNFSKPIYEDMDVYDYAIQSAARYIRKHFREPLTLDMVSDHINMSNTYFSKKFKQITGFGFKEYLINVRIKEAAFLLVHTKQSITEIALSCGFNDSNYFGDAFRKIKGISPMAYRQNKELL